MDKEFAAKLENMSKDCECNLNDITDKFSPPWKELDKVRNDIKEMFSDVEKRLTKLDNEFNELRKQFEERLKYPEFYNRYAPYAFIVLRRLRESGLDEYAGWLRLERESVGEDSIDNDTEEGIQAKAEFKRRCDKRKKRFDNGIQIIRRFVWSQGTYPVLNEFEKKSLVNILKMMKRLGIRDPTT